MAASRNVATPGARGHLPSKSETRTAWTSEEVLARKTGQSHVGSRSLIDPVRKVRVSFHPHQWAALPSNALTSLTTQLNPHLQLHRLAIVVSCTANYLTRSIETTFGPANGPSTVVLF